MWKVQRSLRTAHESYWSCIDDVEEGELRQELVLFSDEVLMASAVFEELAYQNRLYQIAPEQQYQDDRAKVEMSKIYSDHMVTKGPPAAPGRYIYQEIMSLPKHRRCPYCAQNRVKTIDHLLPKDGYPALAVTPFNLVAACRDCNTEKGRKRGSGATTEIINPYVDDFEQYQWLQCEITLEPLTVSFFPSRPEDWNDLIPFDRVIAHFNRCKLGELYASLAGEELSCICYELQAYFSVGDDVRDYLVEKFEIESNKNKNSWKTALIKALAHSDDFCDGEFEYI